MHISVLLVAYIFLFSVMKKKEQEKRNLKIYVVKTWSVFYFFNNMTKQLFNTVKIKYY
jgi:hypothetical protein